MLNVYTDKNHRLKGYARKACENLLNEAVKFGAHTAYLQVVADNGPAYHIYDSLGYKKNLYLSLQRKVSTVQQLK